MAIKHPDWDAVRAAVTGSEKLYRRVERTLTEFNEETGKEEPRVVVSYEPIKAESGAKASFDRIEADVERLVQEVQSLQVAERELRNALEEPGGAEIARR